MRLILHTHKDTDGEMKAHNISLSPTNRGLPKIIVQAWSGGEPGEVTSGLLLCSRLCTKLVGFTVTSQTMNISHEHIHWESNSKLLAREGTKSQ